MKLSFADDEQEPPKKYVVFTHEENGNCFHCFYAFGFEYEAICPARRITFWCVEDDSGYTNCSAPNEEYVCPLNDFDCEATGHDC